MPAIGSINVNVKRCPVVLPDEESGASRWKRTWAPAGTLVPMAGSTLEGGSVAEVAACAAFGSLRALFATATLLTSEKIKAVRTIRASTYAR